MTQQKLIKNWLCIILLIFATSSHAEMALTLTNNDKINKTVTVDELWQAEKQRTTLTADDPVSSKIHHYQGVLLTTLLEQTFGSQWKQFDAVKFVAEDGYSPVIPMSSILAHVGMVAVGEDNHPGFTPLADKNTDAITASAFYLVWENLNDKGAKKDYWLSWPWQLTRIELTSFAREYPRSAPPNTADKNVNQGFMAFQQHCIKCHTINGDGGSLAPELNYPVNVTEYWRTEWLGRFIANPQSVRYNSKMIGFYRDVENRQAIIESITAYLKSMVSKKITPPNP